MAGLPSRRAPETGGPTIPAMVNTILRLLLAIWVIGYVLVSCGPLFSGNAGAGGLGLLTGGLLLVPWLVGVLVLGVFVWLTNPRRR